MAKKKSTHENPGEMYFRWYLEELKSKGYIKDFYREPETIIVLPSSKHMRTKFYKQRENVSERFTLFPEITYTYDFKIIWEEKSLFIFTEIYNKEKPFLYNNPPFISHYIKVNDVLEVVSYVDVKPHYSAAEYGGGNLASFYTFPFVQKFLFATRGLYINKVIPANAGKFGVTTCLFATTFVPNRFRFTDSGTTERKLRIKKTPLESFVRQKKGVIDELNRIEEKKREKNSQQTLL